MPTSTPWGPAQSSTKIARGINLYSCAGHGGFRVSAKLNCTMHPALRMDSGWYEEDCDWARVVLNFTQYFTQQQCEAAHVIAKNYYPDQYEAWFRTTTNESGYNVPLAESSVKRRRAAAVANADKYVVVSARNSDKHLGMVECHGVLGGRLDTGHYASDDHKTFLVLSAEYAVRQEFGFVVDESRHQEVK